MRAHEFIFEITDKVKNQLITKFTKENPKLKDQQIRQYLDLWDRYAGAFPSDKKDITVTSNIYKYITALKQQGL